jgi:hypothetical protein
MNNITESDIMYQDHLVCILKPEVKKGVIVWTHYTQPKNCESLKVIGLKTGDQLYREGIDFGRVVYHPYIFFRAPYFSREIDYSSIESEIYSSYGENQINIEPRIFIRVDPNKTFIFSSELRAINPSKIRLSKKLMTDYFEIINKNKVLCSSNKYSRPIYNLVTSEIHKFEEYKNKTFCDIDDISLNHSSRENNYNIFHDAPPNRNSEIIVSIPHLTSDYFVKIN